jgi:hypothetical protein
VHSAASERLWCALLAGGFSQRPDGLCCSLQLLDPQVLELQLWDVLLLEVQLLASCGLQLALALQSSDCMCSCSRCRGLRQSAVLRSSDCELQLFAMQWAADVLLLQAAAMCSAAAGCCGLWWSCLMRQQLGVQLLNGQLRVMQLLKCSRQPKYAV